MKTLSALPLAVGLLLVGCASTSPDTAGTAAPARPASPDAASESDRTAAEPDIEVADELEISAYADDNTVCRREAPLGSRIAVERCYSRLADDSAQKTSQDQLARDELEMMRRRQMFLEQQRAAREMAIRRLPPPPPR